MPNTSQHKSGGEEDFVLNSSRRLERRNQDSSSNLLVNLRFRRQRLLSFISPNKREKLAYREIATIEENRR